MTYDSLLRKLIFAPFEKTSFSIRKYFYQNIGVLQGENILDNVVPKDTLIIAHKPCICVIIFYRLQAINKCKV